MLLFLFALVQIDWVYANCESHYGESLILLVYKIICNLYVLNNLNNYTMRRKPKLKKIKDIYCLAK